MKRDKIITEKNYIISKEWWNNLDVEEQKRIFKIHQQPLGRFTNVTRVDILFMWSRETKREQAIHWWNTLMFEEQFYKVIAWLKEQDRNTAERHPHSLTGSEIEEIWSKEVNIQTRKEIKN